MFGGTNLIVVQCLVLFVAHIRSESIVSIDRIDENVNQNYVGKLSNVYILRRTCAKDFSTFVCYFVAQIRFVIRVYDIKSNTDIICEITTITKRQLITHFLCYHLELAKKNSNSIWKDKSIVYFVYVMHVHCPWYASSVTDTSIFVCYDNYFTKIHFYVQSR